MTSATTQSCTTEQAIEALLFIAHEPVSLVRLAELTRTPATRVKQILAQLKKRYRHRGITIEHSSKAGYRFTLPTKVASIITAYYADPHTLSDEATETLALIAYLQPITQSQIEAHRPGNTNHALETLLTARLITITASDEPSKLYVTTERFLESADLQSLDELPLIDPAQLEAEQIASQETSATSL